MARIDTNSLATIEFVVHWNDGYGCHEDYYLARRVNLWRDIFPPLLLEKLNGSKEGDIISIDYSPGEIVPGYDGALVREISYRNFSCRDFGDIELSPEKGRFLPKGMLRGINGVYPQTTAPFRVLEKGRDSFVADLNHPFAQYGATIEARIQNVAPKDSDTGGRLFHWAEEICNYGPGMQVPLPDCFTDYVCEAFFGRSDENCDSNFYQSPRLVGHVDGQASENLKNIYSARLKPRMKVLDLMSSVNSHLPKRVDLEVTGLGLNMDELRSNPLLAHRIVHDLNDEPDIPLDDVSFDVAVCSLSIEYLTRPLEVLRSVYDKLRPGGTLMVGVSNRWFPTKVTNGWLTLHEYERMGYIRQLAREAGFNADWGTVSMRNDWRPVTDRHFVATRGISDPVYVVWCRK